MRNPSAAVPVVVDVPHSGRVYPEHFSFSCPAVSLLKTEDRYADVLFAPISLISFRSVVANFPRTFVDVNRRVDLRDPASVIRRACVDGAQISNCSPSQDEFEHRLEKFYFPYHRALQTALKDCIERFGCALHLNLHSFPQHRIDRASGVVEEIPQLVYLGDRRGETASPFIARTFKEELDANGIATAVNDVFSGGRLVQIARQVDPARVQSVQIEVRRDCYLDDGVALNSDKLGVFQKRLCHALEVAAHRVASLLLP